LGIASSSYYRDLERLPDFSWEVALLAATIFGIGIYSFLANYTKIEKTFIVTIISFLAGMYFVLLWTTPVSAEFFPGIVLSTASGSLGIVVYSLIALAIASTASAALRVNRLGWFYCLLGGTLLYSVLELSQIFNADPYGTIWGALVLSVSIILLESCFLALTSDLAKLAFKEFSKSRAVAELQ
jgi:hypothetical protein